MKWGGLAPAETIFDDGSVVLSFTELGPDLPPDIRTAELVRRLTTIAVSCRSLDEVRTAFEDLDAAGLYDSQRWGH